jgi:transposase
MSEELARGEGSSPAQAGEAARQLIRRTRQVTRRQFPTEEKIRIVLEGIRGEIAVSELYRREGIHPAIYYKWLEDLMEGGKGRLRGDTKREATSEEVRELREENERLKQLVAELSLANLTLKKASFRAPRAEAVCAYGSGAKTGSDRFGAEITPVEATHAGGVGHLISIL